jgi:hypothetical protein
MTVTPDDRIVPENAGAFSTAISIIGTRRTSTDHTAHANALLQYFK